MEASLTESSSTLASKTCTSTGGGVTWTQKTNYHTVTENYTHQLPVGSSPSISSEFAGFEHENMYFHRRCCIMDLEYMYI
eukprot:101346-Karenia_brevis.AAC.1